MRQIQRAIVIWAGMQSLALAESGAEIVAKIDAGANKYEDQSIVYEAVTVEGAKAPRTMNFSVTLQGEKRLVEFSAPGDMKGTRVLVLKRNQMYIYLPAYNKVRRVASHVTGQGFMGTTFSDEDMSTSVYGGVYSSVILSDDSDGWTLRLEPLAETETPYGSLQFKVSREGYRIQEIRYFGKEGQPLKTETRSQYRCISEVCSPESIEMVDHTRGDASTTLMMQEFSANDGVDPSVFSVRNLQRGD